MSKKSSVYFGGTMQEHTSQLEPWDSISGRVNRTVDRYVAICKRHGIDLTEAERDHISRLSRAHFFGLELIEDLEGRVRRSQSEVINVDHLADKLRRASLADLVSLIESLRK